METRKVTLALSQGAYDTMKCKLDEGAAARPWISWPFPDSTPNPDYIIELRLDPSLPNKHCTLLHDDRRYEGQNTMSYRFPSGVISDDVTLIINRSYEEAVRCYEQACFLGAIALCGRTMESALGAIYERRLGTHPSQEKEKPGINAIINRLKGDGLLLAGGLKERMEAIAAHRNMAVHGNLQMPTDDECRSVIYSTRDVLRVIHEQSMG